MSATVKMFKKAKLWNRNTEAYHQTVNGEEVHIPAGEYVVVPRRRAIEIRGHYPGKGIKCMLEIEPIFEEVEQQESFVDHRTGQVFPDRESLLKHLGINASTAEEVKKRSKFVCPICDEGCEDKESYIAHMEKCMARAKKIEGKKS